LSAYGKITKTVIVAMKKRGSENKEIATALGVPVRTLNEWVRQFGDLREALEGIDDIIEELAEHKLIQLALGYHGKETKVFQHEGEIVEHDIDKWYPPNFAALQFLLKNVDAGKWQDKKELSVSQKLPTVKSFAEATAILEADPTLMLKGDDDGSENEGSE